MMRFFGMMPSSEIEKAVNFRTKSGDRVRIESGPHGWTINWPDGGCTYKDVNQSTEDNFKEALESAKEKVVLFSIIGKPVNDVCCKCS